MKLLEQLGVYGWPIEDENLMLATLLTGDPLLMVGAHGGAKTHAAYKMAEALKKTFIAYDASKALFEDVLGFPNVESLKNGRVEYCPSAVTIWDKEFVLIDEVNRALPELQSKWLEILRSRKIMGFPTDVKWVWSAMNPSGDARYSGTQMLDAALVGRYAVFIYPPDVLDMVEADRVRVVQHINGDDAPSLLEWTTSSGNSVRSIDAQQLAETGYRIGRILNKAANNFMVLRKHFESLSEFLSRFSVLVMKETQGKVKLDGRRLGFIYRNVLACRSIEAARAEVLKEEIPEIVVTAKRTVISSIPIGISSEGIDKEGFLHVVEVCFDLLADYFQVSADIQRVETIYRLFTSEDLLVKTHILLEEDLSEMAKFKAWNDLSQGGADITALAYISLQVEARRPGTIPAELLERLSQCVNSTHLHSRDVGRLKGADVEVVEQVETLFEQADDLGKILAYIEVSNLLAGSGIKIEDIERLRNRIATERASFLKLLEG